MNGDYYPVLGYLLGGAGIFGIVVSYLQLREQRIEQRRKHLRETALTPAFRNMLGTMLMMVSLLEELGVAQKAGNPELLEIMQSILNLHWDDIENSDFYGSLFFLPTPLQSEFLATASLFRQVTHTAVEAVKQQETVAVDTHDLGVRFDRLSRDLKKALGIE
jgi:hypothetical protein